jgi:hypothetical protein
MPQFQLDTSGEVHMDRSHGYVGPTNNINVIWASLDAFAQGYIEALFFTESASDVTKVDWRHGEGSDDGSALPCDAAFADLAPETLARILKDCRAFQDSRAWADTMEGYPGADEVQAGHDFWLTRNGHGAGFWDGDWPEPYATQLDETAKGFGSVNAYLGDDGKVYLS